ncbi:MULTISPECIES: 30S ribosomal protein S2 [Halobacteriovorax]|uniref:Small ribosomal subunit protein uS2 n=1 Tax=Halobacteriovorax vibrionivorans TaxID=2152716 RepID=A0ABY0IGT4_9BACT|nr:MULTISPECIES: 30S ribosomal protein S2 [Halobacteriovorax]AYF43263.1 30S ribosomal protein S2 [Halobacteriovorax sp. BALOs_7]RZF22161.1 30S ribosomal protein S2 [Halobacteriovorax vibrionivorans]TGD47139.1 30S ribosomal protein S2 [Halobacteriovorax sp. Y22]
MSELNINDLLKAGAHFGHQTHKWNPKMKPYVFGERNGIYILDLAKTIPMAKKAHDFLKKTASEGKPILFVATKRQASETVKNAAASCGAYYVTNRWLGGMLTNYKTINLSIDKLRKVEKMKETGDFELLTKKERIKVGKEVEKLEKNLGGIKDMRKLPGAVVIVDPNNERIAVKEANKLGIPVVAIVDTNCNPEGVDYIVPGNDDAIKSITLFSEYFAGAISASGGKTKAAAGTKAADKALEEEILSKYENDIDLAGEEE